VTSVEGPASGTVSVPGRGYVYSNLISALKNPSIKEDIPVTLGISPGAKGYLVRLYLDVVVYEGQTARDRRFEVPIAGDSMGSWAQFLYPALTRRPPDPAFMYLNFVFPHRMYAAFDNALTNQYSGYTPKRAIFILTQVDPGLYNYYKLANGFLDSYSVRMDQPDYTNIKGGLGVFGAMVEDSMVVDLQ
jgi:hypothetical protein